MTDRNQKRKKWSSYDKAKYLMVDPNYRKESKEYHALALQKSLWLLEEIYTFMRE